jgi:PTS hybrid protein
VIADAMNALEAKRVQLGLPSQPQRFAGRRAGRRPRRALGFRGHSKPQRPARSSGVKAGRRAGGIQCRSGAGERGKCVTPDSLNQIALLQVRRNDTLRLLARGPDADAALAAFQALAAENFGEPTEAAPARRPPAPTALR